MGLFGRLFGKESKKHDSQKHQAIDAVRMATAEAYGGEEDLARLHEALPAECGWDLRLEVVNRLFDMERNDWAEAYALEVAHDPKCPLGVLKGLCRHFIEKGEMARVVDPIGRLITEKPSESEMAAEYGRFLLREKNYEKAIETLNGPLDASPESRHLFRQVGEAHLRLGHAEDAVNHLTTACELYEQAFKLHQVLPDDMTAEHLDFSRAWALLEEAAKEHLGERWEEAFANLTMEPSNFGLKREGQQIAARRIEYTPLSLSISTPEEIDGRIAAIESGDLLADSLDADPQAHLLKGKKALRLGHWDEALRLFRQTLEFDLENFGAYYGWAICDELLRRDPMPQPAWQPEEEALEALRAVMPNWDAMSDAERAIARAAAAPVAGALGAMAHAGAKLNVHPLDVRLKDLFPEPTELRFEDEKGLSPQAMGSFAAKLDGHVRLDDYLLVTPEQFPAARVLGIVLADALEKSGGASLQAAKDAWQKAKSHAAPGEGNPAAAFDTFVGNAVERAALVKLYGDAAKNDYVDKWEAAGVFAMLEGLR